MLFIGIHRSRKIIFPLANIDLNPTAVCSIFIYKLYVSRGHSISLSPSTVTYPDTKECTFKVDKWFGSTNKVESIESMGDKFKGIIKYCAETALRITCRRQCRIILMAKIFLLS